MNARAIGRKNVPALGGRYVKFCLVGGSGVAVDMVLLYLLAGGLGWNLTIGKVIAAEVALFNNFLWNDAWTFRGLKQRGARAWLLRLAKFNTICLAGIGLSVLLLNAMVRGLNFNVYLANFLAIVAVSLWNFFLNLKWGWNAPATPDQRLEPRMDTNRHE